METLKDIFVSYEIAQKLKEIGFDEPCIASYDINNKIQFIIRVDEYLLEQKYARGKITVSNYAGFPVPTWEQVKKWFREKGYVTNIKVYYGRYYGTIGECEDIQLEKEEAYQQAQEQLILKLIEIYKNGKTDI